MLLFTVVTVLLIPAKGTKAPLLVYPRVLEERSSDGRMLLHVHDGLTLSLRKASVSAPEFRVLTVEDGQDVTHFYRGEDLDRYLYEDEKQWATVHVMETESGHEIEGLVGPDRRIQPMPAMERSDEGIIAHMIYNIEHKRMLDEALLPTGIAQPNVSERNNDAEESVPDRVTVELFIISDILHHTKFNQTKHLVSYLIITVNAMNLRYTMTSAPLIQFMFTGVQQNKDDLYKSGHDKYIDGSTSIQRLKSYVATKKKDFGNPDVVYAITGYDMYSVSGGTANTNARGLGYVAGICTEFSVALGEDTAGYYDGVHTMTHETAHVVGSEHDERPPTAAIPGHPGSLSCKWDEGNIMSYVNKGPEHHKFSTCSIAQMRYVILLRGKACWSTTRQGKTREGQYPGMMVSLTVFCRHLFPNKPEVTADMDSPELKKCKVKCHYPVVHYEYFQTSYREVTTWYSRVTDSLDYMFCEEGKVCIRGLCVHKPPTKKPKKPKPKTTTQQTVPQKN